ncbi:hypothetical protein DFJ74DRAFT_13195 [Hyaloraphidium curvatum]|nr:hypothetical protein DFJ74DRAFT_13195 [Hyaloraphidium curvatum]
MATAAVRSRLALPLYARTFSGKTALPFGPAAGIPPFRAPRTRSASFTPPARKRPIPPLSSRAMAVIVASGAALVAFDAYHYLYLHEPPPILDPDRYVPFQIVAKDRVSRDTWRLRFAHIPRQDLTAQKGQTGAVVLDIPPCFHLSAKNPEMQIQRPYTPTEVTSDYIELLVKRYDGGFMTPWLCSRKVGDKVELRGPITTYPYRPNSFREIGMVAGGTGITPMFQILRRILSDPFDRTAIRLVYANRTEEDILLRSELDSLSQRHGDRFSVHYVLDEAPQGWNGGRGYVDARILQGVLPAPKEDVLVFVCGPEPMLSAISGPLARDGSQGSVGGALGALGYSGNQVFKFGAN